jgi:pimeloyl-ACP methyl ester carboxylesterase
MGILLIMQQHTFPDANGAPQQYSAWAGTADKPQVYVKHQFHTLSNGKRLHYTAWGNPKAQPVVCVHGLTRNARDFDFLAQFLRGDKGGNFYVLCPDVLGRGESDWADAASDYAVPNYAAQLIEWMDALKLSQLHWVGTSMGGLIGMMVQLLSPNRLGKVVLNDIGPVIEHAALQRISAYIGAAPSFANRELAMAYAKQNFGGFGCQTDAQWAGLTDFYYVDQPDDSVRTHYDPAVAIATKAQTAAMTAPVIEASQAALWASLKSFTKPVMVLRGEHSDLLSVQTVSAMLACNPLCSTATIPNCGHAPHLMDEPQAQHIADFLK